MDDLVASRLYGNSKLDAFGEDRQLTSANRVVVSRHEVINQPSSCIYDPTAAVVK